VFGPTPLVFVLHPRSTVRVIDPRHIKLKVSTWFRGEMKAVPNEQLLPDREAPILDGQRKVMSCYGPLKTNSKEDFPSKDCPSVKSIIPACTRAISKEVECVDAEWTIDMVWIRDTLIQEQGPASLSRRIAAVCRRVSKSHGTVQRTTLTGASRAPWRHSVGRLCHHGKHWVKP